MQVEKIIKNESLRKERFHAECNKKKLYVLDICLNIINILPMGHSIKYLQINKCN